MYFVWSNIFSFPCSGKVHVFFFFMICSFICSFIFLSGIYFCFVIVLFYQVCRKFDSLYEYFFDDVLYVPRASIIEWILYSTSNVCILLRTSIILYNYIVLFYDVLCDVIYVMLCYVTLFYFILFYWMYFFVFILFLFTLIMIVRYSYLDLFLPSQGKKGDMIGGRYELHGEVGLGTFGRVVECWDFKRRRRVAVKVVRKVWCWCWFELKKARSRRLV